MTRPSPLLLLAAALLTAACSRSSSPTASASSSAPAAPGRAVPELPSLEPSSWVNGAPVSFASARGSVVLVEAWDRL